MPTREEVVLILAYHYPPDTSIGGARPYRLAKYLRRMGYRVHVIAASSEGAPEQDVTYLPDPFLATPRDGLGWEAERFCRRFFLPGEVGLRWARRAAKVGRAFIRENAGRRITLLSTFPPIGPHFAAYLIARSEPVPWIADFRDPLGDSRVLQFFTRLHQGSRMMFERITMKRVDIIVANTDTAAEYFERNYPEKAASVHVIWNGFDPEARIGPMPVPDRPEIVLTHTGALYLGRTAAPILQSLQRLLDSGRLPLERVKVRLIGSAASDCLPGAEFVDHARAQGWLELIPKAIPRDEAVEAMRGSDALLLLQPQSALQVPGKLFEYVLTGRPILALVPRGSPVEWILQNSGVTYRCVHPEDPPAVMDEAVLAFFQSDVRPVLPNAWFDDHFNAERQTEQLDRLITTFARSPVPRWLAAHNQADTA